MWKHGKCAVCDISKIVLIFYCCYNNLPQVNSGLKEHKFITLQFWRSEVWHSKFVDSATIKVLTGLHFYSPDPKG